MDEQSLIYFSLRGCDALLIGYQSGRLLANQGQGKLMSVCRAAKEFVLLLPVLCRHGGYGVCLRAARVTLTASQDSTEEMRICDGGKREKNQENL